MGGSAPLVGVGSPCPPHGPAQLLTARVLCREGLWLSIGVGRKGALWIWPLRVAPLRVGTLWVASLGIGALGVASLGIRVLRVAPLGVGTGSLGISWLAIGGRLKWGLWVRGPRVGRHGGLGPPRISSVGGRIAVPRHQETLLMGHGLRFCGLPLQERQRTVSPAVTSTQNQPWAAPPAAWNRDSTREIHDLCLPLSQASAAGPGGWVGLQKEPL